MRMRKKKYLSERLDAVGDILFISDIEYQDRNFSTAIEKKEYIDLDNWFKREAPIVLEIGCGKGGFAVEYAKQNPEINLLAVEKDANVLVAACEAAKKENVTNLRFIKSNAEYLPKYIKEKSIERIYLNFSCPFPKNKYAVHRLTHERFLKIYKELMKDGAEIHQKTDNTAFFEFSIESLTAFGFALKNVSLDLHKSGFEGNIETEYEKRFSSMGLPIYRLEAYFKGERND